MQCTTPPRLTSRKVPTLQYTIHFLSSLIFILQPMLSGGRPIHSTQPTLHTHSTILPTRLNSHTQFSCSIPTHSNNNHHSTPTYYSSTIYHSPFTLKGGYFSIQMHRLNKYIYYITFSALWQHIISPLFLTIRDSIHPMPRRIT